MEEHDNISEHTATMYGHVQHLSELEYKILDDLVVDGVLHSLHPSYKSFIHVYHMREKYLTFSEKLMLVISVKVKANVGEVIDGEGIYDIHVIDVYPYKALGAVAKYYDTGSVS